MKFAITAVAIAALFSISSAQAAKLQCNDKGMMKVEAMIKDAMGKPKMKKAEGMAMEESKMAETLMKKGDTKGCAMHLNMAAEHLMK